MTAGVNSQLCDTLFKSENGPYLLFHPETLFSEKQLRILSVSLDFTKVRSGAKRSKHDNRRK